MSKAFELAAGDGAQIEQAEGLKTQANELFKLKRFQEALQVYQQGGSEAQLGGNSNAMVSSTGQKGNSLG